MATRRWEPFPVLETLRERMEMLMEESFLWPSRLLGDGGRRFLPVDLYETPDTVVLKAVLPGVRQDDVSINVDRNTVALRAHIPSARETEEARKYNWYLAEMPYGDYTRTITLGMPVDPDKVEAKYEHGILTLTMAKSAEAKPRRIPIRGQVR